MKQLASILLTFCILTVAFQFVSCNSSGCTENRSAVPLAAFYSSASDRAIQLDSVSISGVGAPNDSVLSAAGARVSQVYLPMRPTDPSVQWCLAYKWKSFNNPDFNDTITIDYDSQPYFASEECGAFFRYRITSLKCTDHLIDSVGVIDSLVTNIDKVYLKIYFRVADQ